MIKKIKLLFVAVGLSMTFGITSCKDFLELEPQSQGIAVTNTSADSVLYKSASEVEAALAGCYGAFKRKAQSYQCRHRRRDAWTSLSMWYL